MVNLDTTMRNRLQAAISGAYHDADTLHNIWIDFGYPAQLEFAHFWNMYRRFGIARNCIEIYPRYGWMEYPEIIDNDRLASEITKLDDRFKFWHRLKGLDTRQRVGRYAGMFMRVRDGKPPSEPLEGKLAGLNSLVEMIPLYESQLEVLTIDDRPTSDDYGQPTMYQYKEGVAGSRNDKSKQTFNIHPSRIIVAAEGADNGSIYGIPSLESVYNSLMDLQKICGAGGEGFYKNAAQSIVLNLQDASSATQNAALLADFSEQFDDFVKNRTNRAFWTPGMESKALESHLIEPKGFFENSLNDVASGVNVPATILIGKQTGRLASNEDSRDLLANVNSRRVNFQSEMIRDAIDWMMLYGILPVGSYDIEWPDALALSDDEKLANSKTMAEVNTAMFNAGQPVVFTSDEIREAAGHEAEPDEIPDETLDAEEDEG